MEPVEEWTETDRARRRKSEGKFYNFLNRSAQSLTRTKSQDGKTRRMKDREPSTKDPELPRASRAAAAASRLPVLAGSPEKSNGNYASVRHTCNHKLTGVLTLPTEPHRTPSSPSHSPRTQPRRIVTSTSHAKSTVASSSNLLPRTPTSARPLSPTSPTAGRGSGGSNLIIHRPLAPPITPSSSSSTSRRVLGILLPTSSSRKATSTDGENKQKNGTQHLRSGSGSSHEPLLPSQSRTSDRARYPSHENTSATPTSPSRATHAKPVLGAQTQSPPRSPSRSQYTVTHREDVAVGAPSSVTPRKSASKLDFWRSGTPRAASAAQSERDKGKQVAEAPVGTLSSGAAQAPAPLLSPQARAPVSFLPPIPRLQRTPPTPQKGDKWETPTTPRVDSFMSDSMPIPQSPQTERLTPPTPDFSALSRHPAFVQPDVQRQPNGLTQFMAPVLGVQRSKSAPGAPRGRTSPCLRIPSPKFLSRDKDKDTREKQRKVTPESVGSPILREGRPLQNPHHSEKPSTAAAHGKPAAASRAPQKVPAVRRTAHGSFDFERPGSRNSDKSGGSEPRSAKSDEERETEKREGQVQQTRTVAYYISTKKDLGSVPTRVEPKSKTKAKAPSPVPPLPTPHLKNRSPPPRTRSPLAMTSTTTQSQSTHGDVDDSALPRLSSSLGKRSSHRGHRTHASHPSFSFEPAAAPSSKPRYGDVRRDAGGASLSRATSAARTVSLVRVSDQFVDTHTGLMWAPTRLKENTAPAGSHIPYVSHRARSPPQHAHGPGMASDATRISPHELQEATEVIAQFKGALNDVGFATLQKYVRRYDAQIMPLDGSSGLIIRVQRLLDTSAPRCDDRRKRQLLDSFVRVVSQAS